MVDGLAVVELVLVLVVVAALVPVALLVARRRWLSQKGWVFDCSVRRLEATPSSSWTLGVARFNGETVEWYRVFSWSLRPALTFTRGATQVVATRDATDGERPVLADQQRIAQLRGGGAAIEVAMVPASMTAFLSWLESAPPGFGYRA
nr:DUF2550 family protein [Propionibacterium sp.]